MKKIWFTIVVFQCMGCWVVIKGIFVTFFIVLFCQGVFVKNLMLYILIDSCICEIKGSHNVLNQTIKFDMHV